MFAFLPLIWNIVSGGLLKYWKIILPVLAVLGLVWYIHHLQAKAEKYENLYNQDIVIIQQWSEKFETLDSQYKAYVITCKAEIAKQNEQVEAVAAQAEKFKQQASAAKQQSDVLRKQYEKRIQDILNEPKPADCPGSIHYLIEHAKEMGTWQEDKHE